MQAMLADIWFEIDRQRIRARSADMHFLAYLLSMAQLDISQTIDAINLENEAESFSPREHRDSKP